MEQEKLEAIKQWTNDPCGSLYAKEHREGSKEFFEAFIKQRREIDVPWLKRLIDEIDVKNKLVLDIGCGMGSDLLNFAQNGANVIGIDLVTKHLDLAKGLFAYNGYSAHFLKMDAESLSFASNSVDIIYSFGVLHHTPNIQKAISETHRVLKPKGLAIIGLYHRDSWHYWINLIIIQGLVRGKLLRMSVNDLLSTNVEFSRINAKPLVRVYSKRESRNLFKDFFDAKIKTYHWKSDQIYKLGRFLPPFLPPFFGWYIFISARKR